MLYLLFAPSAYRSLAELRKATTLASALIAGLSDLPFPLPVPAELTLTSRVVPVRRLRAKISDKPLLSEETRLLASLRKATTLPSALITALSESSFPLLVPAELMLTRRVVF